MGSIVVYEGELVRDLDDRWRRMAHDILLLLSVCQMLNFFINLP